MKHPVSFWIEEEEYQQLAKAAQSEGKKPGAFARELVRAGLADTYDFEVPRAPDLLLEALRRVHGERPLGTNI